MAALSFKKEFAPKILRKVKKQTIRGERKHPIRVGERLFLYTGMRTKYCEKFAEALCTSTTLIQINESSVVFNHGKHVVVTSLSDLNNFAISDGFRSWPDMKQWWKKNNGAGCFPFHGVLIEFKLFSKCEWLEKIENSKYMFLIINHTRKTYTLSNNGYCYRMTGKDGREVTTPNDKFEIFTTKNFPEIPKGYKKQIV